MILNYYDDKMFAPSEQFLHKDFGQVASVLGQIHGLPVNYLVCANYRSPNLTRFGIHEVTQIKKRLRFLPSKLDAVKNIGVYWFLARSRKKFSNLVAFPFNPPADFLMLLLFKLFNPSAKIIVKLDANVDLLLALQKRFLESPLSLFHLHFYFKKIIKLADCVLYETEDAAKVLYSPSFLGGIDVNKLVNVYNGVSATVIEDLKIDFLPPLEREKIIIYSGRLSAPEKNVEMIFRSSPLPDGWKIKFIGKVDSQAMALIEKYRAIDPDFDKKYEFIGEILDKKNYFEEFSSGKILLLCSIKEGFPMVFAEAHFFRLHVVSTDVSGAWEATLGGTFGRVVPKNDDAALRRVLAEVCKYLESGQNAYSPNELLMKRFVWENSLRHPLIEATFRAL